MGECSVCGDSDVLTRKCNYCGSTFCPKHTLPEKHNCPSARAANNAGKHFESAFEATLGDRESTESSRPTSKRDTRIAKDRRGVRKDKKPKTPLNEPTTTESGGDSSPDVAPDGSIKRKDTQLDRELDRIREKTRSGRSRFQQGKQKLGIWWLRFKLSLTSIRVWLVVLVAIASMGQLGYAPVPGMPVDSDRVSGAVGDTQELLPNETESNTSDKEARARESGTTSENSEGGDGIFEEQNLNRDQIESAIHEEINERRQQHGLQPITFDIELREIARYHSRDMGENQYFAHTSPSGESMGDRYGKYGYDCRVRVNSTTYVTGAENIAYTYAYENVRGPNGESFYHDSEADIAEGIVNQWMNSTGHRENVLKSYWQNEAIGIYIIEIDGRTKVYATQNFC